MRFFFFFFVFPFFHPRACLFLLDDVDLDEWRWRQRSPNTHLPAIKALQTDLALLPPVLSLERCSLPPGERLRRNDPPGERLNFLRPPGERLPLLFPPGERLFVLEEDLAGAASAECFMSHLLPFLQCPRFQNGQTMSAFGPPGDLPLAGALGLLPLDPFLDLDPLCDPLPLEPLDCRPAD